ncbi:MAG TPA: hypothetical protein VGV34_04340 [Solirubrobacterales bacterium]|nr:hypothetical protein [Solirubrobacterales bacterium]
MNATLPGRRIDRWTVITAFLAAVVLSILPAAPAAAGEVHFDPDSPAGKEYALPLPAARNEAMGKEGIDDEPPSQAPLFGVGVGGSGDGDGGGGNKGDGSRQPSGQSQGNPGGGKANPSDNPQSGVARANPAAEETSYGLGTAVALVGGILLIALALGLALRALAKVAAGRPLGRA